MPSSADEATSRVKNSASCLRNFLKTVSLEASGYKGAFSCKIVRYGVSVNRGEEFSLV